jgi:pimeloyl-ACP methyl ester carboxylesterase
MSDQARMAVSGGEVEYWVLAPNGSLAGALVFLHEGLGSLRSWRELPADLAGRTGRPALVWSRHGYGWSAPAESPWPVDYMHREALVALPDLLAQLGVSEPVLVGHSDGASIALIAAGAGAVAAAGIAVLAPHVFVEERSLAGIRAARRLYETTDLRDRLSRYHRDPDATFTGWNQAWLSPRFRQWNIEDFLGTIRCPVMAVQCQDDPYGTLAQLDRLEAGLGRPLHKRLVFPTGGHVPHQTHRDEVATAIAAFAAGR